jgi:hypothetical protein
MMTLPSHRTKALRPSRAASIDEPPPHSWQVFIDGWDTKGGLGDAILLASHPTGLVAALVVLFALFLVDPTPLEVLLAERIASLWVFVEAQEALLSATYRRGQERPVGPAYVIQMCKIQESVNRRYLAAIKTLAQVRKLQANMPGIQYNTQINVGR